MRTVTKSRAMLTASAALICFGAAGGAAAQAREPLEIEEVIVTATKREEALRNVPVSISAETEAALARRGAAQIDDIVANAPGLSNAGGGANQANLVVRGVTTGVSAGLQQSTVGLFIDDLPADPGAGGLSTTDLRLFDIKRVEVLRGPQGTLFGSGSLSGAVRVITNKPDLNAMSGALEAGASATDGGDGSGDFNAMLNAPIVAGKLGVRAVGYASYVGGDIDNRLTGGRDVNWGRQSGGRLMVAAEPTERLSLLATALYQKSRSGSTGHSSYDLNGSDGRTRASLVEPSVDLENRIYNLVGRYAFDGFDLVSSTSYSTKQLFAVSDASAYVTLLGYALGVPGLVAATPSLTPSKAKTFTQELRLSSTGEGPLRWTVGAYYQTIDGTGGQTIDSPAIAALVGVKRIQDVRTASDESEKAIFGEATYALNEKVDLTAGVRVGRSSVAFTTHSSGVLMTGDLSPATVIDTTGKQSEVTTNPRFAVTYRPSDSLTLYAQASRGFRTGGPNLTAGLSPTPPPATYDSDSLWNFEVGQRSRLAGGAVRLNTTLYYIDWSNIQASLYKGVAYTGNAGDARVYGLEAELTALATRWLEVGSALSLSHGELTKDVAQISRVSGVIGAKSGDQLPASPAVKASAYAQAGFDVLERRGYVRADIQYVGEQFTDFGRQGVRFGDYMVANLRAGVNLERVELIAFANNLFNSDGKTSAVDATFVSGVPLGERGAIRVRPLTVGLTVRARF